MSMSTGWAARTAGTAREGRGSGNRRAQMEMMGLAIVVILLSLAFLFVVRFVILKPQAEHATAFRESELAANFLNTMLETNAPECSGARFSTLFQDCANYYSSGGRISCSVEGSRMQGCEYLRSRLGMLFTETFGTWNVPYYFEAYRNPEDIPGTDLENLRMGAPCAGDRRLKVQPLPLAPPDTLYLSLHVCSVELG